MSFLYRRQFGPLFATQFCGAFNDNLFKNALILMLAFEGQAVAGIAPSLLINAVAALFILPFLLFSITAGECADKWDKARLTRIIKVFEIALMTLGAWALLTHHMGWMLTVIFLLGCHSTFFGPIKFAILPQHLPRNQWMMGNGWIEMGTFAAILLGTNLAGILMGQGGTGRLLVAGIVVVVAVAGYGWSRAIPPAPAPTSGLRLSPNPAGEAWQRLRQAAGDRVLLAALLGNSWFWCYGATFLTQFPAYTRDTLGGPESVVTFLWTVLTLAVGGGSLASGLLAQGRWQWGLVPLGGGGMSLGAWDLAMVQGPDAVPGSRDLGAFLHTWLGWHVVLDTLCIGAFAGIFIVPLYGLIQARTPEAQRARMLGTTNWLNALFMVLAALAALLWLGVGGTIPGMFLGLGVLNAFVLAGMVMVGSDLT